MKVQFNGVYVYMDRHMDLKRIANGDSLPYLCKGHSNYFEKEGSPLIGTATVVIEFFPEDQIVGKQVDALRKQLEAMRAEHQRAQNALIDKISKLQALTFVEA